MNIIQQFEAEQMARLSAMRAVPDFIPGDTLRVSVKVVEGDRTRTQAFEGVCIARSNKGLNSNFTVRKISYGEGVEPCSHCTPRPSPRSRLSAAATSGARSCITCVAAAASPPASPNAPARPPQPHRNPPRPSNAGEDERARA